MSHIKYSRTSKINIGDFAISEVVAYLQKYHKGAPLRSYDLLSENFDVEKKIASTTHETPFYRVIKRSSFKAWIVLQLKKLLFILKAKKQINEQLENATRVIIGGGNLFSDRSGGDLFYRCVQIAKMANKKGIPVAVYAVGMGPFLFSYKKDLKWLINNCEWFSVRDELSMSYCNDLPESTKECVQVIIDPAFIVSDMYPTKLNTQEYIGLNFMNFRKIVKDSQFNIDLVIANLEALYRHYKLPFKIINTSFGEDLSLAIEISRRLNELNVPTSIFNISSLDKLPDAFQDLKFFIASRMHSSIFAMSYNVPTLIFPWHSKVNGLNELLFKDQSNLVLLQSENVNFEEVIHKIDAYLKEVNLEAVMASAKTTIYADYARFLD